MSTTLYVRNGTPAGNRSLCYSCRHAHIQQGYADSEEQVRCCFYDPTRVVQFAVRTCTDYTSRNEQTLYEMKKVAYILDAKEISRRHTAGFGGAPLSLKPEEHED
jgi:hypothetical protein